MRFPGCVCTQEYVKSWEWPVSRGKMIHEEACIQVNEKALDNELWDRIAWENVNKPCSMGPGHEAHGKCPGWTLDRT